MKKVLLAVLALVVAATAAAQYQLPNPGFEQWDGNNTSEPTHWNSFATSDGSFAGLASSPHHYRRNGGRPGSTGSHFLTIYTQSILGIKANGNMTTGRIHAGSTSASSSDNYNYTQRSNADHCQPFGGTPDSMYVWVSFYAESGSSEAQVSAILHGDNDFRSPNNEGNTSLYRGKAVARFTRTTSSATTYQWQQLKVPFVYSGTSGANYMLVNITTNAVPGSGAANDSLSVDDIEFIYSAWLTGISVDGVPVDGFSKSQFAYYVHVDDTASLRTAVVEATAEVADASVSVSRQMTDDSTAVVTVTVAAEDGVTVRTYTVTLYASTGGAPVAVSAVSPERLTVYPNPVRDMLRVEADGEVRLTTLDGREVLRATVRGTANLDLGRIPAGVYLLHHQGAVDRIVRL